MANIIVRPDAFTRNRMVVLEEPFLLIEGRLQTVSSRHEPFSSFAKQAAGRDREVVAAELGAVERNTEPNLRCSAG